MAEKSGRIKVFASLTATSSTLFADLSTKVYNSWDRGLLGLALDPGFPTKPYLYVLYTYDGTIGGTAPKWGTPGVLSDPCPNPPGATADGCVVSARLSRLQASGNVMAGSELVLVHDWFQQYPSHSIGTVLFGSDGALYASGGDGASFNFADYGQDGNPLNPGGDPPVGVGGVQTAPTAEGGALRSQDLRTVTGVDPVSLSGSVIRVDPTTGAALPDNPLFSNPDANAKRIIAEGLRNPFRMTARPGTNEIWVGDVGWDTWEEVNRIQSPQTFSNFGWPCWEGNGHTTYGGLGLTICSDLYAQTGAAKGPYYTYNHGAKVVPGETCSTGSSSTTGLAFYTGTRIPLDVPECPFFRRLLAPVYLGDAPECLRGSESFQSADLRGRGRQPRAADDRARRRPVLRGSDGREHSSDPVPDADGGSVGQSVDGHRAADGALRCDGVDAPDSGGDANLLVGLERGRGLRGFDRCQAELHLHGQGELHGGAEGDRLARGVRHGDAGDQRLKHASGAKDHGAPAHTDVESG